MTPGPDQAAPHEVPFPRYLVALVQDESEMLLQPAYDLFAALDDEADPRWDVELYTERTFEALLRADRQFDCIVIGLNAAWKSQVVRDALVARMPRTGLLVLHQLKRGAVPFLADDVGVDVQQFDQPIDRVLTAEKLPVEDEILLNWPRPIRLTPVTAGGLATGSRLEGGEAYSGLRPAPTGRWRTVLEVDDGRRRVPVLLRTPSGRNPPVVACTVLLQPRHDGHVDLLGNMLMWCVSGRPEALVVGSPDSAAEARLVHRKLRMQGTKAVATYLEDTAALDFSRWPFRGVADVVLPETLDPTAAAGWPGEDPAKARSWLQGGGRISRLGPREQLTVIHGESDAHWVTRRWAAWFHSVPAASWHGGWTHGRELPGSLIGTRAVLRFLAALHGSEPADRRSQPGSVAARHVLAAMREHGAGIDPKRFGLRPPGAYRLPVAALLRRRVAGGAPSVQRRLGIGRRMPHVDYSVSTTCAALDVHALLGGEGLDAADVERFTDWLATDQFPRAALDDKLEIARCLAKEELLRTALDELTGLSATRPLTAALETKLREAVVSCGLGPDDVPWTGDQPTVVERALRMSPLLCANYLVAVGDLRVQWAPLRTGHGLVTPDPRTFDRAVIGVGRHGSPPPAEAAEAARPHEMQSTTALGLFTFSGRHPAPTHPIQPVGQALAPQLVASVLTESEQLRQENAVVVGLTRTLHTARRLLGWCALVVSVGLVVAFWLLLGAAVTVPVLGKVGIAIVAPFVVAGSMLALDHWDLCPPWGKKVALLVEGGLPGIRSRIRARLSSAPGTDGA